MRHIVVTHVVSFPEFRAELTANIRATIRKQRANGDTGASEACLRQCTPTPRTADGPRGTNIQWMYAQIFHECIAELPPRDRKFVY